MEKVCTLGIDIGGTNIKYAKVYNDGKIKKTRKINTPKNLVGLIEAIDSIYESFNSNEIESIAFSLPGKVDTDEGVVYYGGSLPYLHQFNFKNHIKDRFRKKCTIINDGKSAALCELWLGKLKGIKDGVVITLGTGVGGGIIIDGKLHQGKTFQAGEMSFITKDLFQFNNKNITGFELSAVNFIAAGSEILQLPTLYDGEKVFEHIKKGDNEKLMELFSKYVQEIVNLIINLQAILDMEKVLIGGGISEQPFLIDEINRQYELVREKSDLYGVVFDSLVIDTCEYKNNSNILGAVYASKL